jgi:signal transduction histidine kinase
VDSPRAASPPGFEEIQREEAARLYRFFCRARMLLIWVPIAALGWMLAYDASPWRKWAIGLSLGSIFALSVFELVRSRAATEVPRGALALNASLSVAGQLVVLFATGGLESPLFVTTLLFALGISLLGDGKVAAVVVGIEVVAVWVLTWIEIRGLVPDLVPTLFGGGARAGHTDAHLVATAFITTVMMMALARGGARLRASSDAGIRRALAAQADALRAYHEQASALTTLSAEIAHELKNPLSSIKGLGALVAKDVEGKNAERVGVLRKEVERMQATLEEFLNFSRPLVPLACEEVEPAALCADVVALHEGMAHDRGVQLEVAGGSAKVRCDPCKVKQILVNVLQNALDASPEGAAIELVIDQRADVARIEVRDRGAGLAADLDEARVFAPGVTSKGKGSGLGLTIGRALARQHGGELSLAARNGGGCVATLTLPIDSKGESAGVLHVRRPMGDEA